MMRSIVPPYLLARLARLDRADLRGAAESARRTLVSDAPRRAARIHVSVDAHRGLVVELDTDGPDRTISDARGTETLPGLVVRREGDSPTGDPAVDEAYAGLGATHALLAEAFGRHSIDGAGLPLEATVHYGASYDNAFWDGERMVFGDGDGEVFTRFTASLTVIGHELAHGLTQHSSSLVYRGQSGALNESVSDVIGALVEQHSLGQTVAEASWLIGEGLFTDRVEGSALRSMKAPGTAYDDDVLGTDPQPAHLRDYVDTDDDNGGVHINSGIPNRAFYLVAEALGGHAWERAGRIWYDAVTGELAEDADFSRFAAATTTAAAARYGDSSEELAAVLEGWAEVGVEIDERIAAEELG